MLVLGACQAGLSVEVDAAASGSGQVRAAVTLDADAAARVPDLARQLRVEDLERAGWRVDGPTPVRGGGVTLRASKPFASPAGAARAIAELSGSGGPFSSLRLTRRRGLWRTTTVLRGTVDLSAGLGAFGDPKLAATLGGPNLGLDPAAVERDLGRPLAEAVTVELVARLPGQVSSNAPRAGGSAAVWPAVLGRRAAVAATSRAWNVRVVAATALAVAAGLALVGVLVRRRLQVSRM